MRTVFEKMLTYGGHKVALAGSVTSAMRILAESDHEVVVTDINMPEQSGIDLLRLIHEANPDIAVVLITGAPSVETARGAVQEGAFDYISKPPELEEFLKVVSGAARHSGLQRENRRLDRENEEYRRHLEERVQAQVKVIAEKERRLQQAQKLEAIGTLAAGIAHEISTPVQFISGIQTFFCESLRNMLDLVHACRAVLQDGTADKAQARDALRAAEEKIDLPFIEQELDNAITMTGEGFDQVTKILGAMRDFSHMGGADKTKSDLNQAIESTVTLTRNEWKYVADLKLDCEPNLPMVFCQAGEIKQVLLNLIVNAAHAIAAVSGGRAQEKGLITIRSRRDDGHVVISVSDTGTGIAASIRDRVFDPFFTTKEVGKGTGQGLSMAYATVVKQHGGTLTFETEEGKGSTFYVRLPL